MFLPLLSATGGIFLLTISLGLCVAVAKWGLLITFLVLSVLIFLILRFGPIGLKIFAK